MEPTSIAAGAIIVGSFAYLLLGREKSISWPLPPPDLPPYDPGPRMVTLKAAIKNGWLVEIGYIALDGTGSTRTIRPSSIRGDVLTADCQLDKDERHFRVDRIVWMEAQATRADARARHTIQMVRSLKANPAIDLFPAQPRQRAISQAIEKHWEFIVIYLTLEGKRATLECLWDKIVRYKSDTITHLTSNGETVSVKRIVSIDVKAPDERLRRKYSVLE